VESQQKYQEEQARTEKPQESQEKEAVNKLAN
jgi:hypothetical protein